MSSAPARGLVGRGEVLDALLHRLALAGADPSAHSSADPNVDPKAAPDADPVAHDTSHATSVIGLVGDPGVGKSALLSQVESHARAAGDTVLTARGSHTETHLPYASLHQLVRPTLARIDALPVNQREALLSCFAMGTSIEVNPFFVSLAVLELLVETAARAPVLVSLDDLGLMDQPSLEVLSFVARRVEGEAVLFICASRDRVPDFGDDRTVTWLEVGPLTEDESTILLRETAPELTLALRERVLRQSVGNPLALVEIATALRSGSHEWPDLDEDLPMTDRLEAAFVARADHLGAGTRAVLDVAAVDGGDALHEALAAAEVVHGAPLGRSDVQPAVELGLIEVAGDRYRLTHPLIGSALRHAMPLETRHRAHVALATVLRADPDRALWHRASSTVGPDEDVAAALERAAGDARRRGAVTTAVARLERAAALSQDGAARARRLLAAAELEYELGRYARVEQIRTRLGAMPLSVSDRSRLTWLEGVFHDGSSSEPAEVRRLVALARRVTSEREFDLALQLLFGAGRRVWWRDPGEEVRRDIVRAVRAVPLAADDPRVLAVLALADSLASGPAVLAHLEGWPADARGRPDLAGLLGIAAFGVGDHERAAAYLSTAAVELRAHGRLSLLAEVLAIRAWAEVNLGIFDPSRSADEAMRLGDETGQAVWAGTARIAVALADAVRGDWDPDHPLLAAAERTALVTPNASSSLLAGVQLVRGIGELGRAQPAQAYAALRRTFVPTDPAFQQVQQFWALGYLADAAVPTGRREDASEVVDSITGPAGPAPSPVSTVAVEYARAVLADDDVAEELFGLALAGAARRHPWHLARLQFAQGSWLRRQRRVVESREPLREARGTFATLGADVWAARADAELRATGEQGWRPLSRPREHLSVQERRIAELAAQGLSNRDIGERLFLSHRTVSSHLYRIFPKLGITSRGQLTRALAGESPLV
ncbi:helix-turn-helix transcriptional regulator [Pedococcus soli]